MLWLDHVGSSVVGISGMSVLGDSLAIEVFSYTFHYYFWVKLGTSDLVIYS